MSLSKTDKYILEELKKLVRVYNDKIILDELKAIIEVYNDKWITIHPHGEDSDDYRRIKLEDGETPKEAIDRVYKKDNKDSSIKDLEKKLEKLKAKFQNDKLTFEERKNLQKEIANLESDIEDKKAYGIRKEKTTRTQKYRDSIETKRQDMDKILKSYQDINAEIDKYSEKLRGLIGDITDTNKINEIVEKFKSEHKEVGELSKKSQDTLIEYNKKEEEFKQLTSDIADEILKTDIENLSEEDLVDLQDAVKLTESFSVGYDQREKLTAFKRKIKDKIDSSNYNKNRQELTEVAGVKKGQPMDHTKADNGNVNPNYKPHSAYSENCQSCVVCYELRRRGFNVKTKPRVKYGYMQALAEDCTLAYIDPKTGKQPSSQQLNVTTPDKAYDWLDKNIGDGRYEFRIVWKDVYKGHIITAYRENNKLVLYDPQTNKTYNTKEDMKTEILNKVRYRGKEITKPYILRVDNLDFNSKILDSIVEA